ncbi:MAG TPA: GNAT family protein [Anaerolineales bacterium]|nr:GNAT family protein [Anaerolineales bacterium]
MHSGYPRLETDRLVLKQITSEDWQAVLRHFSDAEMLRWMDFEPIASREQAEDVIRWGKNLFAEQRGVLWGLFAKESGTLIGTLAYVKLEEESTPPHRAEITFDLVRVVWGQGLMVEAIWNSLPYVFDEIGVARIETTIHPKNLRSASVLLEIGFRLEGVLRRRGVHRGRPCDVMMFALLRDDWRHIRRNG